MTKRDFWFLLLLSGSPACIAGATLFVASALLRDRQDDQRVQQKLEESVQKVQSGELHPKPDALMQMLANSRSREEELRDDQARFLRILSCGVLFVVVAQLYFIFRLRAGERKVDV